MKSPGAVEKLADAPVEIAKIALVAAQPSKEPNNLIPLSKPASVEPAASLAEESRRLAGQASSLAG